MDRRSFVALAGAAAVARTLSFPAPGAPEMLARARPRPSPSQLAWQRDELAMFLHFGVNTFSDREWGDGRESPTSFAPSSLDARQWARVARAAGFKAMVLTAKHHDGFCLWPTRTTSHCVASSPFRSGQGDVVREFTDACKAEGLRAGLYLSPWDRNSPVYGEGARYNDLYAEQLTELLTRYGTISEVWFDGANGEGPSGKRQQYDWPRVWALVRRLQPGAVIFSDAGPDVRWCGNERGDGGEPNWSTVNPGRVTFPGATAPGTTEALQNGDRDGTVWRPAEADTSIRRGWFYHAADDAHVRSADELSALYVRSVGRNAKLLLNVPPTPAGLLHDIDVARLQAFRERRNAMFAGGVATRESAWSATATNARMELALATPSRIATVRIAEDIARGQRIAAWTLEARSSGAWSTLARGTTVGYARILTGKDITQPMGVIDRIRFIISDVVETPLRPVITLFG